MKKPSSSFLILALFFSAVNLSVLAVGGFRLARADEYEDLQREKEQKQRELREKRKRKEEKEEKKGGLAERLTLVERRFKTVNLSLSAKRAEISRLGEKRGRREEDLARKKELRNKLVRLWYKRRRASPLELFLGAGTFSNWAQKWSLYKAAVLEGERQTLLLNLEIVNLKDILAKEEVRKKKLEGEVAALSLQSRELEGEKKKLEEELVSLTNRILGIQSEIAGITARQEELIREKMAATTFFTSVGETEQAREVLPPPPFSPAFVVFSFGYPHRVGMSQYGAFGRAKAGQSAEEIIHAYYAGVEIRKDYPLPDTIGVDGYGRMPFESYLLGIAEMPTKWADEGGFEALKAQAVVARTYALAATGGGAGSICASAWCQVYRPDKASASSAERWHEAVRQTRNWVIVYNGEPIKAYYSSTFGGYSRLATDFDVRWNSSPPYIKRIHDADGEGKAFDGPGYGNSPWFYRAWYDRSFDAHPYLTKAEMVDLLNASLLPAEDNDHLSLPENGGWTREEVVAAVKSRGMTPIDDFSEVKTVFSSEGYTMMLRASTPSGTRDIDGKRFRKVFILRSRGHLALWSSLYDVVQK